MAWMAMVTSCVTTKANVLQVSVDISVKPKRNRNWPGNLRHFGETKFVTIV